MAPREPECPECRTVMETGFVLDQTYGANVQSSWIRGAPERSVWTGVKLKGRDPLPITTHRCPKCWYLEFYAPPP